MRRLTGCTGATVSTRRTGADNRIGYGGPLYMDAMPSGKRFHKADSPRRLIALHGGRRRGGTRGNAARAEGAGLAKVHARAGQRRGRS